MPAARVVRPQPQLSHGPLALQKAKKRTVQSSLHRRHSCMPVDSQGSGRESVNGQDPSVSNNRTVCLPACAPGISRSTSHLGGVQMSLSRGLTLPGLCTCLRVSALGAFPVCSTGSWNFQEGFTKAVDGFEFSLRHQNAGWVQGCLAAQVLVGGEHRTRDRDFCQLTSQRALCRDFSPSLVSSLVT